LNVTAQFTSASSSSSDCHSNIYLEGGKEGLTGLWQLGPPSFAALQPFALQEWVILQGMKYLSMQEKQTLLHLK